VKVRTLAHIAIGKHNQKGHIYSSGSSSRFLKLTVYIIQYNPNIILYSF
jgi:hypothetical protein